MNARWAVLAGACSIGTAWVGRTLAANLPPDVLSTLPGAAQAAIGAVALTLVLLLALSALVSLLILILGGEIT